MATPEAIQRVILILLFVLGVGLGPTRAVAEPYDVIFAVGDPAPPPLGGSWGTIGAVTSWLPAGGSGLFFVYGGSLFYGDGGPLSIEHIRMTPLPGVPAGMDAVVGELQGRADGGLLVFDGWVFGNGGTTSEGAALFASDSSGSFSMVLREDDDAPGQPAGTRFAEPSSTARINSGGGLAVRIGLRETPDDLPKIMSIWQRTAFGALSLRLREQEPIAGLPHPLIFARPFLNEADELAAYALDSSGAKMIVVDDGIGGFRSLIRDGDADPAGLSGTVVGTLCCGGYEDRLPWALPGTALAIHLEIGTGGVDSTNNSVLLRSNESGGLEVVARKGEPIPGRPGESWGHLSYPILNDAGQILFHNAYPNYVRELVLWTPGSDPIVIVEDGQQAPGFPVGTQISNVDSGTLSTSTLLMNDGTVSFSALLPPLVNTYGSFLGAQFVSTPSGILSPVAVIDDLIEIRPGEIRHAHGIQGGLIGEDGGMTFTVTERNEFEAHIQFGMVTYAAPEPSTGALFAAGLSVLVATARRRSAR